MDYERGTSRPGAHHKTMQQESYQILNVRGGNAANGHPQDLLGHSDVL